MTAAQTIVFSRERLLTASTPTTISTMSSGARQHSPFSASLSCVCGWLLALIVLMTGGLGVANFANDSQPRSMVVAAQASPSLMAISAPTAQELDEIRNHGHHHSGNPLEDLLTLGHAHFGCQCASLTVDIFALAVVPNAAFVVMRKPQREHDSPPNHPFRPPIV